MMNSSKSRLPERVPRKPADALAVGVAREHVRPGAPAVERRLEGVIGAGQPGADHLDLTAGAIPERPRSAGRRREGLGVAITCSSNKPSRDAPKARSITRVLDEEISKVDLDISGCCISTAVFRLARKLGAAERADPCRAG